MPPPFELADPATALKFLARDAANGATATATLLDARLRTRRGATVGWALYRVSSAHEPDVLTLLVSDTQTDVYRFPADPTWPTLSELIRQTASQDPDFDVVKYQPGTSCTIRTKSSDGSVVYRKFRNDGRARLVAAHYVAVATTAGTDLRTAQLVDVDDDSYTTAEATGKTLPDAVDEERPGLASDLARMLAALHSLNLAADRIQITDDHMIEATKKLVKLTRAIDGLARDIGPLSTALGSTKGSTGADDPTVLHGDLNTQQVLVDVEALTLLDLDSVALGPPERDLAELAVDLLVSAPPTPQRTQFVTALVDAYEHAAARRIRTDVLAVFAASELVTRAWRHHRRGQVGWSDNVRRDLAQWSNITGALGLG